MENKNKISLYYHIEDDTFNISPKKGYLPPKSITNFTIAYTPQEAVVNVSTAVINIEDEDPYILKMSGIGKYPYLTINTKKINFESLLVGKYVTKEVIIKN